LAPEIARVTNRRNPISTAFFRSGRTMDNVPWYNNFPDPRSMPRSMTDAEVSALVRDPEKHAGRDYIIVDVRRTDFEVPLTLTPTSQFI
jgi:hypothetical protein